MLLRGVGMIKSTPEAIIANGTNWKLFNELKAELPATPVASGAVEVTGNLLCQVKSPPTIGRQRPRSAE